MTEKEDLHPWGVISSCLFELSSDEVSRVIGLTGLQVDWMLTKEEAFSHATRNRAYLTKIQSAYKLLTDGNKLRVAWIVL